MSPSLSFQFPTELSPSTKSFQCNWWWKTFASNDDDNNRELGIIEINSIYSNKRLQDNQYGSIRNIV